MKHPIVREALRLVDVGPQPYLEITSMSDIPAGTGLGSSGSFTTALLRALHAWKKNPIPRQELAEQACHIEIDLLRRADRQAGSIHRGVRRHHLLSVPARRPRGGGAAATRQRDAGQPGRQSAAVLHRLHALGFGDSEGAGHAHAAARRRYDLALALRETARLREQGGAGARRSAPLRRADARALGAQEGALAA